MLTSQPPANGLDTSPGNLGDPLSCQTSCVAGYYKSGISCLACDTTSCAVGQYRQACTAATNGQCVPCTKAPPNAQYISAGIPYNSDACTWACMTNFFSSGTTCSPCSTGSCPALQSRTPCTAYSDSVCAPINFSPNGCVMLNGQWKGPDGSINTINGFSGTFKGGQSEGRPPYTITPITGNCNAFDFYFPDAKVHVYCLLSADGMTMYHKSSADAPPYGQWIRVG